MSLKEITPLLVLLPVLAACRLTYELEVPPSVTPPPLDFTSVPALSDSQVEQGVLMSWSRAKSLVMSSWKTKVALPTRSNMRAATFG